MSIGVFDSGVGGLTVHHRLVERFQAADFVYLADQANAPYGGPTIMICICIFKYNHLLTH